jgi:hypothetical protein
MSDHFAISSFSWICRTWSGDKTLLCGRALVRSFALDPSIPFKTVDGGAEQPCRAFKCSLEICWIEAECCIHAEARGTRDFQMSISNVPCGKLVRFAMHFSHLKWESQGKREIRDQVPVNSG